MHTKGYSRIPRELFNWITFLTKVLPPRSVGTFIELLIGSMLSTTGFVTDSYRILRMSRHWTSYYKWLQEGRWSWLDLSRQFARLLLAVIKPDVIHLAIDDTLTLRASKKAPGSQIHHQHGSKPNLAQYVRGQCWVSLAWTVRVLVDSWYMRKTFIEAMLRHGFDVIGQVRIDTRLYDEPKRKQKRQRGRPRKYGEKYTPKRIAHLKKTEVTLWLYGKEQTVRYRSKQVMARFLDGRLVRAVWCEFKAENGKYKSTSLLLSTDTGLTAEQVIESYARRWSIESMFNQLKLSWGIKEAWQQTRQVLHRWVHITMISYGLVQLLGTINSEAVKELCRHSPWRKNHPVTAGQIRLGLGRILSHVNVRSWWNRKCKKFEPPDWRGSEKSAHKMLHP